MNLLLGLILLITTGCSSRVQQGQPKLGKTVYAYADASGAFQLLREKKQQDKRIITRSQLLQRAAGHNKTLEKSVTVSQIGSVQVKKNRMPAVRPLASDFTVWLEGKQYSSKMRLDTRQKAMQVSLDSPEKKWQGSSLIPFPKGRYFCFYSQLADCLYHNGLLKRVIGGKGPRAFMVVWDNWPYAGEMLTNAGQNLFSQATVNFEGEDKNQYRIEVEVDGQIILYYFSKSFDLVKIAWIAQGISVVPLGEEAPIDDE